MPESHPSKKGSEIVSDEAVNYLGSTVGSFTNRLQRKLKEQEILDEEVTRAREIRHSLMLQAMTTIRRALQETCKIRLGERFCFALDVSDWEGWPRVEVQLVDNQIPEWSDLGIIVTAHDRKDQGIIQISMRSGQILGRLEVNNPEQFTRIPTSLKRCVRQFLDCVGYHVLNAPKPEVIKSLSEDLKFDDEIDPVNEKLKKENVFEEELQQSTENLVSSEDPGQLLASVSLLLK